MYRALPLQYQIVYGNIFKGHPGQWIRKIPLCNKTFATYMFKLQNCTTGCTAVCVFVNRPIYKFPFVSWLFVSFCLTAVWNLKGMDTFGNYQILQNY